MLAALLNVPKNDDEWAIFSFHHRASHQAIRQAIETQHKKTLPDYPLDPIPFFAFQDWLKANQSAHQDMDAVLGSQSSDIEDLNPLDGRELQAWIWLHYVEHQTAERVLGIGS